MIADVRGPGLMVAIEFRDPVTGEPDAARTAAVIAHCREHLARFKVPKHVEFCVLPKTSTGKIQKFVLRQQAKSASAIE